MRKWVPAVSQSQTIGAKESGAGVRLQPPLNTASQTTNQPTNGRGQHMRGECGDGEGLRRDWGGIQEKNTQKISVMITVRNQRQKLELTNVPLLRSCPTGYRKTCCPDGVEAVDRETSQARVPGTESALTRTRLGRGLSLSLGLRCRYPVVCPMAGPTPINSAVGCVRERSRL